MSGTDTPTVVVETSEGRSTVLTRPLPRIEVRRPSAKRGADASRAELDGPRCVFCDVPVAEDEQDILTDACGTYVVVPICKGHLEHPESWHRATGFDPERVRYCDECDEVATDVRDGACFDCRVADMRERQKQRRES